MATESSEPPVLFIARKPAEGVLERALEPGPDHAAEPSSARLPALRTTGKSAEIIDLAELRRCRAGSVASPPDFETLIRLNRRNGENIQHLAHQMDETLHILNDTIVVGRDLVGLLDRLVKQVGETSAFNRRCQEAIALAEGPMSEADILALEAQRDALAADLKRLMGREEQQAQG